VTRSPQADRSRSVLRTFIAVELDTTIRDALSALHAKLAREVPHRSVRWVRPEGIHLTLKFLGDTPETKISKVSQTLMRAAAPIPAMDLTVVGLGCFPNPRRPRVIWVGIQERTGTLKSLWQSVEEHISPLGWPTDSRGFHPHLTLGRVNRRTCSTDTHTVGQLVASARVGHIAQIHVTHVSFIRSTLMPSGAEYATLAEAKLLGTGPAR